MTRICLLDFFFWELWVVSNCWIPFQYHATCINRIQFLFFKKRTVCDLSPQHLLDVNVLPFNTQQRVVRFSHLGEPIKVLRGIQQLFQYLERFQAEPLVKTRILNHPHTLWGTCFLWGYRRNITGGWWSSLRSSSA